MISTASTTSTSAVQFSLGLSKVSIRSALAVTLLAWNAATTIISENAVTPMDEPMGSPPRSFGAERDQRQRRHRHEQADQARR